jgi:hypothetical protein
LPEVTGAPCQTFLPYNIGKVTLSPQTTTHRCAHRCPSTQVCSQRSSHRCAHRCPSTQVCSQVSFHTGVLTEALTQACSQRSSHRCAHSNSLPRWPGQPCSGEQWSTCFYLMETLTQNSTISPPSLLGSHCWVTTTPAPYFNFPTTFVVHIWQTHALLQYLSLLNRVRENATHT